MNRKLLLVFIAAISCMALQGQKKSELIADIGNLKVKLDSTEAIVQEARKNEKISKAKAESFEGQVKELQEANATLLKNLNSFAEVSSKNSSAINQALGSLEQKEKQLKSINDAIARNDSTLIVVLTNAKQTLGEDTKIGVASGSVVISSSLDKLFGDSSKTELLSATDTWLGQVASILKANPEIRLTIEGLTMTGALNDASAQAGAVSAVLQKNFEIDPGRITTLGKDGNFKEGVLLKLHPNYDEFYLMVKERMKNGN